MTKLTKSELEQAKNNLIRSDGKGGLTEAEDIRLFQQHIIDTIFHLTDSTSLQKLIADLQKKVNQLQNQITNLQANIQDDLRNQNANITDILQQIAQNQNSIGGLQQAITQAQTRINQLQSQANSNTSLIQSLQTQIDQLKDNIKDNFSSQDSILTDYQVITLSVGENVVVHNFNLSNPDAWRLSLKQDGEEVYASPRTRDKDSIFITSNIAVTVSLFLTAQS